VPDETRRATPIAPRYAWYVVGVLMLLNVSSFIDRQVMALLVTPIQADLDLTDTEISMLLGPAFGVTFAVAVFFMGRLADRFSRRALVAWGVAVWSVMCMATGVANTFGQVFAARVGVGAGEATLSPSAFSLIADYFPPRQLATAMSVFTSGVFLGAGLAYLIGGLVTELLQSRGSWTAPLIGEIQPWQSVFIMLGAPGLLLALLAFTIREPARSVDASGHRIVFSTKEVFGWFRKHSTAYLTFGIGIGLFAIVNYGTAFWFPAFFERSHGWGPAKIGLYMGGATAIFGVIGALFGGRLADWYKARGHADGNLRVLVLASLVSAVVAIPLFVTASEPMLIASLIVTNIVAAMPFGAAAAAAQEMSPAPMRGQTSAILVFILNFIGLGLGPPAVALMTDNVFRDPAKVGMSLLVVSVGFRLVSALTVWIGLSSHKRAVAEVAGEAAAWRSPQA
jgi:MFS family permease